MTDKLLTPAEAAQFLAISTKTLLDHANAGEIAYVIVGRGTLRPNRRYLITDIEEFIESRRTRSVPAQGVRTSRSTLTLDGSDFMQRLAARNAKKKKEREAKRQK